MFFFVCCVGNINQDLCKLQMDILRSRLVIQRLRKGKVLASFCIEHSRKRSRVQFYIIVTIVALAVLYEFFNGQS